MGRRDSLSGVGGAGARGGLRRGRGGFALWRWILLLLPVLIALFYGFWFYRMPSDFFRNAPGASVILKGMLASESPKRRQAGLNYLLENGGARPVHPKYFDALLQSCSRMGEKDAACLYPVLMCCFDEHAPDASERLELARRMLEKVRPIIKKYPDDPRFLLWTAALIKECGDRADTEALERAFRTALVKFPDLGDQSIILAPLHLLGMKTEMAPYDRLVELGLAPRSPEKIVELPFHRDARLHLQVMLEFYLRALYEDDFEKESTQLKAHRVKVAQDVRLGDFFFHLDRQTARDRNGWLLCNIQLLSAPQRARYYQLATEWLLAVPDTEIDEQFVWRTVEQLDDARNEKLWRGQGRFDLHDRAYYQMLEELLHSKWKERPNPSYNPDDPQRDNNYKTMGEVFQSILDDRAKDAEATGGFRAAARDWEKALGLEGLMIGPE